ncbi:MAG: efflux RND transporter periplasmic adaptor subunit [Armatimonadota bacterium]
MSRKAIRWVVLGVLVAGAGTFGFVRIKAARAPKVQTGRIVSASEGDLVVKVTETGTLDPVVKVDVKSRVGGRVRRIFVRAGDTVRGGDPIALVDPTEVSREVAGVKAQLDASRAGLRQAVQNRDLAVVQNGLSVRRAEVGLDNARTTLRDAEVGARDASVGLADAELGVAQADKRLAQGAAPTRPQELEQAEAALRRSEAQLVDSKRLLERRRGLLEKGFLAQQDVDSAATQVRLGEADVDSARQRIALLREGPRREDIEVVRIAVDGARMRVEQAKVRVEQAKVRVEQARVGVRTAQVELETQRANAAQAALRLRDVDRARADVAQVTNRLAQQSVQLAETRIVAPIGGEVTARYLEEGELVASATAGFAQGAALVTIADLSRMQVKVNVNEVDVVRLRRGLPVDIRVDGISGRTYRGRVASIAPASLASSQPGTTTTSGAGGANAVVRFEVKVAVENGDARLRPGMSASVDIILDRKTRTTILPAEALRPGDKVVVVTGDAKSPVRTERSVKVGLRNEVSVEVLEGLRSGDRVEVPGVDASDRRRINIQDGP